MHHVPGSGSTSGLLYTVRPVKEQITNASTTSHYYKPSLQAITITTAHHYKPALVGVLLHFHFAYLDRGLDVGEIRDITHNRFGMGSKGRLEIHYRIEIQMAHCGKDRL